MVPSKMICIVIVLLSVFDIAATTCRTTQNSYEENYNDCTRVSCEWTQRWTGTEVYSCFDSNIDEIYDKYENRDVPEKKIFVTESNITLLDPTRYSWKQITEIHFSNTNTSHIVPGFFNTFEKLQVLEITNNQLQEIVDGVFSPLSALSRLNLSSNLIQGLTQHSFSGLLQLKFLDLSNNQISTISPQAFSYQKQLEQVNLSGNRLQHIDNAFVGQNSLKTLNLSKNKLIKFDFLQIEESSLTELDLSENFIENLTETGNVVNLNVSHNRVHFLIKNFCALDTQIVDLSYNNISEISTYPFQKATSLEYLYLDHNKLTNISSDALIEVENLKYLDLSFNTLGKIPFALFIKLQKLTYLDLSENHMLIDFRTVLFLKALKVLKLQKNKIKYFDPDVVISRLKDLTFLSLDDDSLKCTELANTINLLLLNKIDVAKGNTKNTSNIFGISCVDNTDLKEDTIILNKNGPVGSEIDYKEIKFFFNIDFKNTSFYRFFENFGQHISVQNSTNVTKDVSDNAFIRYLNENFTKTGFYKYMEKVKSQENASIGVYSNLKNILNNFSQKNISINYKQRSESLLEKETATESSNPVSDISQNLKKLLIAQNNQNKISLDIKDMLNGTLNLFLSKNSKVLDSKSEHQAIIRPNSENVYKPYSETNLVLSNVLLVLLLVGMLGLLYFKYLIFKQTKPVTNEQLQLM